MVDQAEAHPARPQAVGYITFWVVFASICTITITPGFAIIFLSPVIEAFWSCGTSLDCINPNSIPLSSFVLLFFVLLPISFGIFLLKVAVDFYALKPWTYRWAGYVTMKGLARLSAHQMLSSPEIRQAFGQPIAERKTDG